MAKYCKYMYTCNDNTCKPNEDVHGIANAQQSRGLEAMAREWADKLDQATRLFHCPYNLLELMPSQPTCVPPWQCPRAQTGLFRLLGTRQPRWRLAGARFGQLSQEGSSLSAKPAANFEAKHNGERLQAPGKRAGVCGSPPVQAPRQRHGLHAAVRRPPA